MSDTSASRGGVITALPSPSPFSHVAVCDSGTGEGAPANPCAWPHQTPRALEGQHACSSRADSPRQTVPGAPSGPLRRLQGPPAALEPPVSPPWGAASQARPSRSRLLGRKNIPNGSHLVPPGFASLLVPRSSSRLSASSTWFRGSAVCLMLVGHVPTEGL